jgi:hypothetical protein
MNLILGIILLSQSQYPECMFHKRWANRALYITQELKVPEENWHIEPAGFDPEDYVIVMAIKHEAYHDVPALFARVNKACLVKRHT